MSKDTALTSATTTSLPTAQLAIGASAATLLALAILHFLSPEFDPSWRMVSEYANGQYGWVLSLMFFAWAASSWLLTVALWSHIKTLAGKIGLYFLIAAGIGETMGGLFDINHPLHSLAALIGIGSLPVAAMLISPTLSRNAAWSVARRPLLVSANLTWISLLLMAASFVILIVTFTQAGGDMSAGPVTTLPAGVIALVGWVNRFLIAVYCAWVTTVAWQATKISHH